MKSMVKISNNWADVKRSTHDFLRYTFTPGFGIMLSIASVGGLTIIAIVRHRPALVLQIFCVFIAIFLCAMVVNFFLWRKYRKVLQLSFQEMKVIDLIIKLQQLPLNMEVMLDQTTEASTMFRFVELNYCDEVTTALNEKIVLLSPNDYVTDETE